MVADGFLQFRQRFVLPCGRLVLLGGVCPPVTIMKIYHYVHSQILRPLGFGYDIGCIAPVAVLCRVYPHTQANRIQSALLHQGGTFKLLAVSIIEAMSGRFHFRNPTDVGAFGKRIISGAGSLLRCRRRAFPIVVSRVLACNEKACDTQKESNKFNVFHDSKYYSNITFIEARHPVCPIKAIHTIPSYRKIPPAA